MDSQRWILHGKDKIETLFDKLYTRRFLDAGLTLKRASCFFFKMFLGIFFFFRFVIRKSRTSSFQKKLLVKNKNFVETQLLFLGYASTQYLDLFYQKPVKMFLKIWYPVKG
jgi:hypothetical protein